jgi:phosphoglycolate phosphatase-like HAD superfamily hydrolase
MYLYFKLSFYWGKHMRFVRMFLLCFLWITTSLVADPLPSWNDGPAKQSILNFVAATTNKDSLYFVPVEERFAVFDQDGTLWVEQPLYTQLYFIFDQIKTMAEKNPEILKIEPYKTILQKPYNALENVPRAELYKAILKATTSITTDQYHQEIKKWFATARDIRWERPFTHLTYLPMREVINYLKNSGYKTYIVTGGEQDFVRSFALQMYGIPSEQVIGTAPYTKYEYQQDGKPFLMRDPKFLLQNNYAGKAENIHLIIGRKPQAAFGNSTGDQQMLEFTKSGNGLRLAMLVLHDDAIREYAYGPAQGLPDSKIGTFPQSLYNEAQNNGWIVISMKNDWKQIFSFDPSVQPLQSKLCHENNKENKF